MHFASMPLFYFHLRDDLDTPDEEGAELPDLRTAEERALWAARTLMCETLKKEGRISINHRIDIEDREHRRVGSVVFGEAFRIDPSHPD